MPREREMNLQVLILNCISLMGIPIFYLAHANVFVCTYDYAGFYTPMKSWRGYIFTAVCLCVCLSVCLCVCPARLENKIPAERIHRFGCGFRKMVAYYTGSNPNEIGDLVSKVKVTVTQYPFFLFFIILC